MKSKDTLIALYHAGKLAEEDQLLLERMLEQNEIQLQELGVEENIWAHLSDDADVPETQKMDERFYAFLEKQDFPEQKARVFSFRLFKHQGLVAAAIGILLAFWGGMKLGALPTNGENEPQQELLSSVLDTEDISERIHLISSHKLTKQLDKQVLDALLFSLINDESNNVRLAAIEVLSQFSEDERVRQSLIRSIGHQASTIVLIEIAQVLKQGGQKISTEEFFTYINKDMHPTLQQNLKEALKLI